LNQEYEIKSSVQTAASAPRAYRKVKKTFRSLHYRQNGDQPPQVHKTSWSQEESSRLGDNGNELDHGLRLTTRPPVANLFVSHQTSSTDRLPVTNNDVFGPTGKVLWDDEQDYAQTVAPLPPIAGRRGSGYSSPLPVPPPVIVSNSPPPTSSSPKAIVTTSAPYTSNHLLPLPSPASSNQAFGSKLSRPIDVFGSAPRSSPLKNASKPAGKRRAATLHSSSRDPLQTVNFKMQIQHQPQDSVKNTPISTSKPLQSKSRTGKLLTVGPLQPPKLDSLLAGFMKNNPLVIPLGKRVYTLRKKTKSDSPSKISSTTVGSPLPQSSSLQSLAPIWGSRVASAGSSNNAINSANNKKIARFGQLREIERENDFATDAPSSLQQQQKSNSNSADLRSEYERNAAEIRDTSNSEDEEEDDVEPLIKPIQRFKSPTTFSPSTTRATPIKELPVQIISWRQAIRHRAKTHEALQAADRFEADDVQKRTTLATDDESSQPEVLSVTTPSYGLRQEREPATSTTWQPSSPSKSPVNREYVRPLIKQRSSSNKSSRDSSQVSDWTSVKGSKQSAAQNLIKKSLRLIDTSEPVPDEDEASNLDDRDPGYGDSAALNDDHSYSADSNNNIGKNVVDGITMNHN
jgi:hypothetical protein